MSRVLVVNPNTNIEMTQAIEKTTGSLLRPGMEATVIKAEGGFEALESFYDYSIAAVAVMSTLNKIELNDYDGVLIACFGDPGLYAFKESLSIPVVGIAEASIAMSLLLGASFSIITASDKAVPMMENMVAQYGQSQRCAGVFSTGASVLALEEDEEKTAALLLKVGQTAVEHGAEVLLLGCAGLTGYSSQLEKELSVAVIDPIVAGFKMLEAILTSGYTVSRRGLYQAPPSKPVTNMPFLVK